MLCYIYICELKKIELHEFKQWDFMRQNVIIIWQEDSYVTFRPEILLKFNSTTTKHTFIIVNIFFLKKNSTHYLPKKNRLIRLEKTNFE